MWRRCWFCVVRGGSFFINYYFSSSYGIVCGRWYFARSRWWVRRCCFSFSSSSLKNDESSGGADCMIIRFWLLPLTTTNDTDAILVLLGTVLLNGWLFCWRWRWLLYFGTRILLFATVDASPHTENGFWLFWEFFAFCPRSLMHNPKIILIIATRPLTMVRVRVTVICNRKHFVFS